MAKCSISTPPESVRKPIIFWRFQGGIERGYWAKLRPTFLLLASETKWKVFIWRVDTLKQLHQSTQCSFHAETSRLTDIANQMTVFYMKYNTRLTWVKQIFPVILAEDQSLEDWNHKPTTLHQFIHLLRWITGTEAQVWTTCIFISLSPVKYFSQTLKLLNFEA